MGILVDMSGDTLRKIHAKGLTDRQVVNCADWDINDVFNDSTTRGTWHRHMTRLTWLLIAIHEFESGTASK